MKEKTKVVPASNYSADKIRDYNKYLGAKKMLIDASLWTEGR